MATFEGYERRIDQINPVLAQYGLKSLEEADELLRSKGIDVRSIVLGIQPIAFENAVWAYTLGAAIAVKKNEKTAAEASECIGEGLQTFCIPGSVADQRKVGIGHGNLGAMRFVQHALEQGGFAAAEKTGDDGGGNEGGHGGIP